MLVSKQLCSVNVDKGINMQKKNPQTKTHTDTKNTTKKTPKKQQIKTTTKKLQQNNKQTSKNKDNII
jgi:hypothetical protein